MKTFSIMLHAFQLLPNQAFAKDHTDLKVCDEVQKLTLIWLWVQNHTIIQVLSLCVSIFSTNISLSQPKHNTNSPISDPSWCSFPPFSWTFSILLREHYSLIYIVYVISKLSLSFSKYL